MRTTKESEKKRNLERRPPSFSHANAFVMSRPRLERVTLLQRRRAVAIEHGRNWQLRSFSFSSRARFHTSGIPMAAATRAKCVKVRVPVGSRRAKQSERRVCRCVVPGRPARYAKAKAAEPQAKVSITAARTGRASAVAFDERGRSSDRGRRRSETCVKCAVHARSIEHVKFVVVGKEGRISVL